MPLIDWQPSFSVGHPELDQDHQNLVELINTLHEAWEAGEDLTVLAGIFGELQMYTDYHFRREESLLEACDYAHLDEQRRAHAALRQSVEDFRARHLADRSSPVLTIEIEDFLKTWMMHHILEEDMRYRPVVEGRA